MKPPYEFQHLLLGNLTAKVSQVEYNPIWKKRARVTPAPEVALTPDNFFYLTPIKSWPAGVIFVLCFYLTPLRAFILRMLSPLSSIWCAE